MRALVAVRPWSRFLGCTLFFTTILLFLNTRLYLYSRPNDPVSSTLKPKQCNVEGYSPRAELNEHGHVQLSGSNLPFLIDELLRINHSVRNELVELDQRRRDLLASVNSVQTQLEHVRSLLFEHSKQFLRLRASISSHEYQLNELTDDSFRYLHQWPTLEFEFQQRSTTIPNTREQSIISPHQCTVESCLNWKRCPLGSFLKFCLAESKLSEDSLERTLQYTLTHSSHYVPNCETVETSACLKVAIGLKGALQCLNQIEFFNAPTCLVLLPDSQNMTDLHRKLSDLPSLSRIIFAAPTYPQNFFRPHFDFIFPVKLNGLFDDPQHLIRNLGLPLIPGRRSILLATSVGRLKSGSVGRFAQFDAIFVEQLLKFSNASHYPQLADLFQLHLYQTSSESLTCWPNRLRRAYPNHRFTEFEWFPCQNVLSILRNATFGLVLDTWSGSERPDSVTLGWQLQLLACLSSGAIPIVFGHPMFPLNEAITHAQWSRAVLRLPRPRVNELPYILQSISESHLVEMRRQGRFLYQRHFKDDAVRIASLFLAVSRRLGFPQPPAPEWISIPAFRSGHFEPDNLYQVSREATFQTDLDDFLGPVGPQQSSTRFPDNYTGPGGAAHMAVVSSTVDADIIINPFWTYPSVPWGTFLPSDAAFSSYAHTSRGLRPINHSINFAGYEFNMHLGGMHPYEQFTIVMLTYNRFEVACQTLEGLLNLPYLHSVVVVWNHPVPPSIFLSWPQLHVPIKVVHANNNSLNNRFRPYDLIVTDAVLSVDDDVQLRHDEIVFGFRVWREHRDQLVGFPARAHFWNSTSREWYYHSDYTCEFSMVLTGATFFHKYYAFAYTLEMPLAIRQMVDEQMNCEDLAMNFLVAHLTRKPPLKATIHWTFNCPTCDNLALHDQPEHYHKRSICLNWLTQFYGYNPLVYSQYRADSLLFKTRIPPTKQKCYKFI
ncbi:hypothetical protein P879_08264 [Paragonimus westermani]|uniref:Glycosyl transferase 64 domain-containing protein n=1 Tax=Paragonimus westermani TaxID=34504 RepID=A0A8T0D9J2_9TREM|nr:hypothetical protein P879_08264 [Paragonimus westermani]